MRTTILGMVREWIQWNCLNGSSVTWGSAEILQTTRGGITVKDIENVATEIEGEVSLLLKDRERLIRKVNDLNKRLVLEGVDDNIVWEGRVGI